ncbi:hypothetical protein L7F22_010408 [Adiantum nelumboides]|nr:hypothetical protein [Adiantum nelumboides]
MEDFSPCDDSNDAYFGFARCMYMSPFIETDNNKQDLQSDNAIANSEELTLLDEHSIKCTKFVQEEISTDLPAFGESLNAKCPVLQLKDALIDAFLDDDNGWGFDEPLMEGSLPMDCYVQKSKERLQSLKIQKQVEKSQHVSKRAENLDPLVEGLVLCTRNVIGNIMADTDIRDLMDAYDNRGVTKAGVDVMSDESKLVCTYVQEVNTSGYVNSACWEGAWSMLACALATWKNSIFDAGGCVGLENLGIVHALLV